MRLARCIVIFQTSNVLLYKKIVLLWGAIPTTPYSCLEMWDTYYTQAASLPAKFDFGSFYPDHLDKSMKYETQQLRGES